ncbi:MAG: hypothetical protein K2P58_03355 [Hyphomonadaceae bacterium]|nr:hypothetical protein [Hyphomonadaceae bacterium]
MRTFEVVKLTCGWSVRSGVAVTTPCRSRAAAIAEAERMAERIRCHGEGVQVIVVDAGVETPRVRAAAADLRPRRVVSPGPVKQP